MTVISTREQVPQLSRPALPGASRPLPTHGAGITGRDIVRILRKRKWLIIVNVFVFLAVAGVSTALWLAYSPFYTAEALLMVNPPRGSLLQSEAMAPKDVMDRMVALQAQLAKSRPVLEQAVSNPAYEVHRTAWYAKDRENALQRLIREIKVAPVAEQNIIRVSFTDTNKDDVAIIANAVAMAAEKNSFGLSAASRLGEFAQIDDEMKDLAKQRERVKNQKMAARPADIPFIQDRISLLGEEIKDLVKRKNDAEEAEKIAKGELRELERLEEAKQLENAEQVLRAMSGDHLLRSLEVALVNHSNEYEAAKNRLGPQHRQVLDRLSKMESLKKELDDRRVVLAKIYGDAVKQQAMKNLSAVRDGLISFGERLEEKKMATRELETMVLRTKELEDQERSIQDRVNKLENRKMELSMLAKAQTPVYLGNRAFTPFAPALPQWKVMIPLGLFLGLMVGLGLSFMLELIDTSVKSAADIGRRTDLPVLGMIPHLDDIEDDIEDLRLAFKSNPNSLVGESFRQIRTCLLFSGPASQRRSLVVTSPQPEDGRTTVAVNLAAAMACGGRRILVVDANFRQPAIRKLFPQCTEAGLSNALVGETNWRAAVTQVEGGLSVMASGPMPPNPAELLQSEQMRQLLAEMTTEYDQVVFDTAPCLIVSDACALAALVDGVILTVRAGANTYGIVQRARDMLNRMGGHIIGVALNGVRTTVGGYLRKHYEAFYDYHEQQLPKA